MRLITIFEKIASGRKVIELTKISTGPLVGFVQGFATARLWTLLAQLENSQVIKKEVSSINLSKSIDKYCSELRSRLSIPGVRLLPYQQPLLSRTA